MNDTVSENVSSTSSLPQLPKPQENSWLTTYAGSVEVMLAATALFGNTLFIMVFCLQKKLRTTTNMMLVNLSITDLISPILVSSVAADSFFFRRWRASFSYCALHNALHPTLLEVSLWLTACIAVNRYICIVHNDKYHRLNNKVTLSIAIAICWCFPITLNVYLFSEPNSVVYVPDLLACLATVDKRVFTALLVAPSLVTVASYFFIFLFIRRSRQRIQAHGEEVQSNNKAPSLQEIRTLKFLVALFLLIILGYLPIPVSVAILQRLGKSPTSVYVAVYPSLHIAGSINPILYGMSNKSVRESYKFLLTGQMIFGRTCCTVQQEQSSTS
ncbi:G-protein coupled receptor moody-like [Ptychodera flava]|uniref:G-protein coupled receptor moody-like n=1 Tax=Ptychodera flava TaxID=63121 RepID=UPI00396A1150